MPYQSQKRRNLTTIEPQLCVKMPAETCLAPCEVSGPLFYLQNGSRFGQLGLRKALT